MNNYIKMKIYFIIFQELRLSRKEEAKETFNNEFISYKKKKLNYKCDNSNVEDHNHMLYCLEKTTV